MEVLGVGPVEFLFIVIIALIVFGPKDMEKAGRTIGDWLNKVIHSDTWDVLRKTSEELRHLPNRLMRESNYEKHLDGIEDSPETRHKHAKHKQAEVDAWSQKPREHGSTPHKSHSIEKRHTSQPHPKSKAHTRGAPEGKDEIVVKSPPSPRVRKPASAKKSAVKKPPTRAARKKTNA